jgi:hypothetical protein
MRAGSRMTRRVGPFLILKIPGSKSAVESVQALLESKSAKKR